MQDELPAILVTNEHLLSARVPLRGHRLLDVLNDRSTAFLSVTDVQVFRRQCNTCIATLPKALVQKTNIALAIPAIDKHEAPGQRSRTFVSKRRYHASLIVLGYEVRGELALSGTDDSLGALCQELGTFFPVPDGAVSFDGTQFGRSHAQVVIVNKEHLSLFQLGDPVADKEGVHKLSSSGIDLS